MKIIVTTGPSYEPIDEVRRLTNFSTGELGIRLANQLAAAGLEVVCLKGAGATYPEPLVSAACRPFTTNEDLFDQLTALGRTGDIGAVFHVAALCDYKIRRVEDMAGQELSEAKINSRGGGLTLTLQPALKIIGSLRALFPSAVLVGWKFELNGSRHDALAKVWRQLRENRTDACVLNGRAWGSGFAFCTLPDNIRELADKPAVAEFLTRWVEERLAPAAS